MLDVSTQAASPLVADALHAYAATPINRTENGQCVYSRDHGPAVFIRSVSFSSAHPENSRWEIRPLFASNANAEVVVRKGDLQPPIRREAAVDIFNVLRGTTKLQQPFCLTSASQIDKIIASRDVEQMTGLLRWLHAKPRENGMKAQYATVLDRVSEVVTLHVLLKHDKKEAASLNGFRDEMRRRVVMALNGSLGDNDIQHVFGFQERDMTRFDLIAARIAAEEAVCAKAKAAAPAIATANPAVCAEKATPVPAAIEVAATAAQVADSASGKVWYRYPPKPQIEPKSAPRELPPHHYPPQRSQFGTILDHSDELRAGD